jgi:CheY-like chemotaxis protein
MSANQKRCSHLHARCNQRPGAGREAGVWRSRVARLRIVPRILLDQGASYSKRHAAARLQKLTVFPKVCSIYQSSLDEGVPLTSTCDGHPLAVLWSVHGATWQTEEAQSRRALNMKPVVLCVDDDLDGLIGREALLKQHGCNVLISTSPREGLKLFASCHTDAVVLDYQMPDMCGDVLASRMKRLKPDVPIMLLSAEDELAEEVLDSVDLFFSKREPPRSFVAAVQDLFTRREQFYSKWLRDWKRKLAA